MSIIETFFTVVTLVTFYQMPFFRRWRKRGIPFIKHSNKYSRKLYTILEAVIMVIVLLVIASNSYVLWGTLIATIIVNIVGMSEEVSNKKIK